MELKFQLLSSSTTLLQSKGKGDLQHQGYIFIYPCYAFDVKRKALTQCASKEEDKKAAVLSLSSLSSLSSISLLLFSTHNGKM